MSPHRRHYRRNADELSAKEEALYEQIGNTEYTEAQYMALERVIETVPFTTTALGIIAAWLIENDDRDGGMLVLRFADEFARHEAKTI